MARLSKPELEEIVARDLPGYVLVRQEESPDARSAQAEPDDVGPDIEQLREKYLGTSEGAAGRGARAAEARDAETMDDAIVTVQPRETTDPFDHPSRPKTVVVSGTDRRIVGSQG
jgi:hypothetical protein